VVEAILGIDAGTHGVRVIAADPSGKVLGEGRDFYPMETPRPGWVEQDPELWWRAFINATREAVTKSGIEYKDVVSLSFSHQRCTVVPVDEGFKPLRKAILWNDTRAVKNAEEVKSKLGLERVVQRTGFQPSTNWGIYKALWVKENEPSIFKKTYKWLLVHDYFVYRLTGILKTSASSATMAGAFDPNDPSLRRWAVDILDEVGLDVERWPEISHPGEPVGHLTHEASKETGLPRDVIVGIGGGDQPMGALGAGVIKPGLASLNLGTSIVIETVSEKYQPDARRYYVELNPALLHAPEGVILGGTRTIDWFLQTFNVRAESALESLTEGAEKLPAGNYGLMLVPYWNGAANPLWDAGARGVIAGFGYVHDTYAIFRAILEGIAYEVRWIVELMEERLSTPLEEIRLYGGGSKNPLWCQIIADIIGKKTRTLECKESSSMGAVVLAAKAAGIYKSVRESSGEIVKIEKTYNPKPENKKIYDQFYRDVYSRLYNQIKDLMHHVSEITGYYP